MHYLSIPPLISPTLPSSFLSVPPSASSPLPPSPSHPQKGPGGYDFLSVNGEPVLSDVNTGRFNGAHQPKLFLSQYAPPGSMWYCWKHKPSAHVNVNDVWDALRDADLAFSPISDSDSREGVFPLTYLRGVDGIFIAVANTTERAFDIYQRAVGILSQLEEDSVIL